MSCWPIEPAVGRYLWRFAAAAQPHAVNDLVVVAPVVFHFDEVAQHDFFFQHFFQVFACGSANELQGFAAFADDDAFLAVAFDDDGGVNLHEAFVFLVAFDDDAQFVGDFLMQVAEEFFAHDFGGHEAQVGGGDLFFIE